MTGKNLIHSLRNLFRGRLYSFINMACLAVGMAAFVLVWLYVADESGYDRAHTKSDRIYRVIEVLVEEGGGEESSSLPFPLRNLLLREYPQYVESAVRLFNYQSPYAAVNYGYRRHIENKFFFTDSSFFDVFDFPLLAGNKNHLLTDPNTVVISQQAARKYFGDADPIGKVLRFDNRMDLRVTGVAGKLPGNSHIDFDFLISMETLGPVIDNMEKNWVWNPAWTYIVLREGVQPAQLEKLLEEPVKKYIEPSLGSRSQLYLQPVTSIHLHSDLDYEIQPNSAMSNVYIFLAVGLFIVLIACVNFMNLSTARSAARIHEVSIRKVSGASRGQLISQFLTESLVFSLLSVLPALALVELLLPVFNQVSGKSLSLDLWQQPGLLLMIAGMGIAVGVISGIYPALFLSGVDPLRVFKGGFQQGRRSIFFRKALVVFQFTISIALIIATVIASQQLAWLRSARLGFDKNNVIIVPCDRTEAAEKMALLRAELSRHRGFVEMTTTDYLVGVQTNTHDFIPEGRSNIAYYPGLVVDRHFVRTMGMQIVAGRDFSDDPAEDTLGILINESMVKQMNWSSAQEALGKQFKTRSGKEKVIGVVRDFHFTPLRQGIGPVALDLPNGEVARNFFTKYLAIRVLPGERVDFLEHLRKVWGANVSTRPFDYFMLDEEINRQYAFEEKLGRLLGYFALVAIFIACLSLFGLSAFTTQQRTREISIRKVLGATSGQIVRLLLADFLRLVMMANVLAIPMAWVGMSFWLRNFPYHNPMPVSAFLIAGVVALGIALLTTSYHAVRAALASPVNGPVKLN